MAFPSASPTPRLLPQTGLFLAALALFLIATFLALTQAPRPFPLKPDTAWEWFRYPLERNAFARMPRFRAELEDVFIVPDSGDVWIVGTDGLILHSRDGGATWEQSGKNVTPESLGSVFFSDRDHGWAVGLGGTVLATENGGRTWQLRNSGSTEHFASVQLLTDGRRGWAVGLEGAVLATQDGGQTWQPQDSGSTKNLFSVRFLADGQHGWVVGEGGTILATEDGGQTWQPRHSGSTGDLFSVQFLADGRRGWAVGGRIVVGQQTSILSTVDGGQTWQPRHSGSTGDLFSVQFLADGRRGWAVGGRIVVGQQTSILSTVDGGQTWQPQSITPNEDAFSSIRLLPNGKQGWLVGTGGTILATTDGGNSWRLRPSDKKLLLQDVQFSMDGRRGWVVGGDGTILASADGGKTWQPQASGSTKILYTVEFLADGQRGWIVGDDGTILATADGGKTWQPQTSGSPFTLTSVQFLSEGQRGWAAGGGGRILATEDGGQTWRPQLNGEYGFDIADVQFLADGQRGWAVGLGHTILATANGGQTWQPQASSPEWLVSIQFLEDGQKGWAVGARGTILATMDGGKSWQPQASGVTQTLNSVQFLEDGLQGWVVGGNFTILTTTDGGQTWNPIEYRRYPAPWYGLTSAFLLALAWLAIRRRPKSAETTIADLLASDRPLRPGDPDALDFSAIAQGVSRFLRNPRTEPPLTLAVSGEWGTGKSSLMNLIRHDVQKAGFSTVWFNAWHHQKGEQLLASLFANIRAQALPRLASRAGVRFRLNLLARRSRRHWLLALGLTGFGAAALAFLLSDASYGEQIKWLLASGENWSQERLIAVLAPLPVLGGLVSLYRAMQGFGLDPSKLIATVSGKAGRAAPLDPGARFRFAQEFADVAAALRPGRLVVFIDDLDRCSKENVVEVLESLNFLVSSGDCFIVLGMAREWVETCVALGFKELAEETGDGENPDQHRDHRREFARKYLQKLINIEVPLPRLDAADSLRLLPRREAGADPPTLLEQGWRGFSAWLHGWRNVLILAGLAGFGVVLGWGLNARFGAWLDGAAQSAPPVAPAPKPSLDLPLDQSFRSAIGTLPIDSTGGKMPANPPEGTEVVLRTDWDALTNGIVLGKLGEAELVLKHKPEPFIGPPAPPRTPDESSRARQPPEKPPGGPENPDASAYTPGMENAAHSGGLLLAPGLAFGGLALWWLLRSPVRLTEDSGDFLAALTAWYPWIAAACPTPRLVKRFLNRVRYFAMRHRPPTAEPESRLQWIWRRLNRRPPPEPSSAEPGFDESALVALSAIHEFRPEWLLAEERFERWMGGEGEKLLAEAGLAQAASLLDPLAALSDRDRETVRSLRKRFLDMVGDVRMA